MDREDQLKIVQAAHELEVQLERLNNQKRKKQNETYNVSKPKPPERKEFKAEYPGIESDIKYPFKKLGVIELILVLIVIIGITGIIPESIGIFAGYVMVIVPIVLAVMTSKERKRDIERIKNSNDYIEKCKTIDKEISEKQKAEDKRYDEALCIYNMKTIPEYNEKKRIWKEDKDKVIAEIAKKISEKENRLGILYNSKIIPKGYRNIEALDYMEEMMESSTFDIKEAIASYDSYMARQLDEQRIAEQQAMNKLQYEANCIAEESNSIANRARREANVASVVGVIQRHNTNKYLRDRDD